MGEDLDVAVDRIHAVGDGVCPAAGTAEEYAIDGQVLAVVHAQVPAEGSTAKDADILAGSSDLAIDQGPACDVDGQVVFQEKLAGIMHAGTEVPYAGSSWRRNPGFGRIGEQGQIRIVIDPDVQFLRPVYPECQFVLSGFRLYSGACGLDGVLVDLVRSLYRDCLRTITGKPSYVETLHSVGTDLLDPYRYVADSH